MLDADGNRLTGAKRYTMTFEKTPPYIKPAFWALSMFDAKNPYPVPNPLNRYVNRERFQGPEIQRGWIVDHLPAVRQPGW
jgi:hypothetical protein